MAAPRVLEPADPHAEAEAAALIRAGEALLALPDSQRRSLLLDLPPDELAIADRGLKAAMQRRTIDRYACAPHLFAQEVVRWQEGQQPAAYQLEALQELAETRRLALRGPRSLGKTAIASLALHWHAQVCESLALPWKAPTIAGVARQLYEYLWPEVHHWARLLDYGRLGRQPYTSNELLTYSIHMSLGRAFCAASSDPESVEGAHGAALLVIVDEAKIVPAAVFDSIEGMFANTEHYYILVLSTPGPPAGRFYEIHARRPGYEEWASRHVTLEEATAAGRVSPAWAEQRRKQWGEGSALYRQHVLGEFAADDEDSVIPLAWVEAANERWLALQAEGAIAALEPTRAGIDIARGGRDQTILAPRSESIVGDLEVFAFDSSTMRTAGWAVQHLRGGDVLPTIDVVGVGAGVVDRIREQGFQVDAFNGGAKTDRTDSSGELRFTNARSAAWWGMRERLSPDSGENLALPPVDELIGDLTAPRRQTRSDGRIMLEPKELTAKRIGRSPDFGDAVVMAFWEPEGYDDSEDYSNFDRLAGGTTPR